VMRSRMLTPRAQMSLAAVLPEIFERQVARARDMYQERRDAALGALAAHMPDVPAGHAPREGFLLASHYRKA